ncbi:hypothetical protein KJ969_01720 [Patescibacteria group bacterium]|nr:hypothetical protein [Patescibacteria group bacterium]MBU1921789.1 hypothetical protein [Patescibacteria group bacterium]
MMFNFQQFGLRKKEVRKIIEQYFKENADILIGVDDPEVNQFIEILVDAFVEVIDINNKQLSREIEEYVEEYVKECINKKDTSRY